MKTYTLTFIDFNGDRQQRAFTTFNKAGKNMRFGGVVKIMLLAKRLGFNDVEVTTNDKRYTINENDRVVVI